MGKHAASPLKGLDILVTRAGDQAVRLISELESLGAKVRAVPAIEMEPLPEPEGLKEVLRGITKYDHLVFTSVNGVYFFLKHLKAAGLSPDNLPSALCVGPKTAEAWRESGGMVGVVPEKYSAEELAKVLGEDLSGTALLVLRPERVKTELGALLRERGCEVDEIILYRTVVDGENADQLVSLLDKGELDAVLFASPSAVEGTMRMAGNRKHVRDLAAVCIGPATAKAALKHGMKRVYVPDDYTIDGMIELLTAAAQEIRDRR